MLGCVSSPPAARGSQEAGITQPSLRLLFHVCTVIKQGSRYASVNDAGLKGHFPVLPGLAKRWALGCVIPASWLPLATWSKFTQHRDQLLADPCNV